MLATLLRAVLLIEIFFYIWVGGHMLQAGVTGTRVAAFVFGVAFAWRISHGLATFMLATVMRFKHGHLLLLGNNLFALAGEIRSRVISYSWSQPFDALAMPGEPVGPSTGLPVLLVHGYISNRGMWVRFRQRICAAGIGPVYSITLEPLFGSIDDMASQLATKIEAICHETGREKIAVVAHSMGGLVTRAYLCRDSSKRIAKFITLGSPHHGSRIVAIAMGECAKQMRVGSTWLGELEKMETVRPPAVPTLSIYTLNDDLVAPPDSAVLSWAENVPVAAIGHVGLLFSESVADRVIAALRVAKDAEPPMNADVRR